MKIKILFIVSFVVLVGFGLYARHTPAQKPTVITPKTSVKTTPATKPPVAPAVVSRCHSNTLDKQILISTADRHMWACQGTTEVYDSAVITGYAALAADITPTGTFHVYSKTTDTVLSGSDSTGSWNDPVSYWMPFLSNQYGIYGFHDATWRANSAFGKVSTNVSPQSGGASHGCVELPLATAKWLYNWAPIGTTLTIS